MPVLEMSSENQHGAGDDDYDVSFDTFDWQQLSPVITIYGATFMVGLIGNCLIVFTLCRYRRMQNATNVLLTSLACADLLLIIFCIPVKVAKLFSYTWTMGGFLCKCVHYMQNLSSICSVLTLTAISIERYYAIVHPMRAKYICTISQAKRIILFTWVLSIFLAIPILFVQIHLEVGNKDRPAYWCARNLDNELLWRSHEIYMLFVLLVGPFSVMTYAYVLICWEVWRVMERRSKLTSVKVLSRNHTTEEKWLETVEMSEFSQKDVSRATKDDMKTVKQIIYMLVAVVIVFAICWAPLLIDNILTAYQILTPVRGNFLKHMSTAFHLMAYFNSCINPIIYGFMSKNFRESFQAALCCPNETILGKTRTSRLSSTRQMSRTGSQTRSTLVK